MPSEDIAISARNLTKTYRLFAHPGDRVKQAATFGLRKYHKEFTALRDVSFDIRKGEAVGIIGRNGSGKSTLLQLICGILKPTSGTVRVNGRVSALLELGAGFNPEFTGRENVYFQGALQGFTKTQMGERFEDIAAFADIGEFIEQPVRTYSSGMFLRLAFAVAVHVDPEILMVDEALAVGDVRFQARCFRRFEALKEDGVTVLFVSHSAEQVVRLCGEALLIDSGDLRMQGPPRDVTNRYLDLALSPDVGAPPEQQVRHTADPRCRARFHLQSGYNQAEYRWGDGSAQILDFWLDGVTGVGVPRFSSGETLGLTLHIAFFRDVERPIYGITVKSPDGVLLFGANSRDLDPAVSSSPHKSGDSVRVRFNLCLRLTEGDYFLSVGVAEDSGGEPIPLDRRYDAIHIQVTNSTRLSGFVDLAPEIMVTALNA